MSEMNASPSRANEGRDRTPVSGGRGARLPGITTETGSREPGSLWRAQLISISGPELGRDDMVIETSRRLVWIIANLAGSPGPPSESGFGTARSPAGTRKADERRPEIPQGKDRFRHHFHP